MGLKAIEVPVSAKAETRGLEMAFLEKIPWAIVSVISQSIQRNQRDLNRFSITQLFKHMDALKKQIWSLVDYVLNQFLDVWNVKQILTRITKIKLL